MKKDKNYWGPVWNMFCDDYPELAEEVVDWYPSAQMEITVKVESGMKYSYDFMTRRSKQTYVEDEDIRNISDKEWRQRFATNLCRKMTNIAMTQDRLSELTGISQVMISKYTNGKAAPTGININKMARAMKCSIAELTDIY